MRKLNLSKLNILEPRLDWLSVLGDIDHLDRDRSLPVLVEYFKSLGFHQMAKRDRPTFRSNIYGIEVSFGRKRKTGIIFIKIEFQGQFFADSTERSEEKINLFVDKLWKQFGVSTPPKVTRIDLATDIFDISHKKIFPDFAKERYQMITNSKNAPKIKHAKYHANSDCPSEETGISVYNSRFEFALYERIIKLDDYAKVPHKAWYVNYYRKEYEGALKVLRIETRLKKELCEYFNVAFFVDKKPLKETIKKSYAHFNHHHRFFDTKTNSFVEHIDRLYYREEYESIKTLKQKKNKEDDLQTLHFTKKTRDINPSTTQIARTLIANGHTSASDIIEVAKNIQDKIIKEADFVHQRMNEHKKTMDLFSFDPDEQRKQSIKFYELSMQLGKIQKEHADYDLKVQELFANKVFLEKVEKDESEEFKSLKPYLVYKGEEE